MGALDRRTDPRNRVLHPHPFSNPGPGSRLSRLIVDRAHPFFFDHPLDHVPGLLLLEAGVQAAHRQARSRCFVSSVDADFLNYTLFDRAVDLRTTMAGALGRLVCRTELVQDCILRARVEVTLTEIGPLDPPHARGKTDLRPCPGGHLNKARPENVLITTPVLERDHVGATLLPLSRHCLFSDSAEVVHPLYLLEAFMQVQRFLNVRQDGDRRIRDILTGVSFGQTAPIVAADMPVALRGARRFGGTGGRHLSRRAELTCRGQAFAVCAIRTARAARKHRTHQPA